ncbi:MAG: penicillin-binding transpeptidase domain-containing protein [Kofleriaceae bacterium]|nr:penicillin-binding transpeptidase domain-containing protein [Kofleriaceae bacterium]
MRRSFVLLAGAAVVAGGAAILGGDDAAPAASIGGAPLVGSAPNATAPSQAPASEVAAFQALAHAKTADQPTRSQIPVGALIDLDHIERVGDVYEAPLADGRRAQLTLDPELQPLAEKLLDESRAPRAAIVVMHPDGRVLALAGRRTEEPKGSREGTFDWRLATDVWAPAASVFKIVTASALVGAGVDGDDKVCFHGGVRSVMESNLVDSKRDSRCESLSFGLAHSNNAILGKLAYQKLPPEQLDRMAHTLGLTSALPGKELPGNAGEMDIPKTRDLSYAKTAAGFMGSRLSVAGGALLAATIADGGNQPVPRLIASIDGTAVPATKPRRAIPEDMAREVAKMMIGTCDSGSAAKIFNRGERPWKVAGKTGTLTRNEPFYMEHSWFVGFAPAERPEVIVSVLFGNPENWHLRGHEAAKRLIDRALRKRSKAKS